MSERPPKQLPSHDVLARLAVDDPAAYEALRCELIEQCIGGSPAHLQPRLRRLQFRIDGVRRRSRSPLGATLKIQGLMWESFLELNDRLQSLLHLSHGHSSLPAGAAGRTCLAVRSARILEFQPRPSAGEAGLNAGPGGAGSACP